VKRIQSTPAGVRFLLKVVPGASRSAIAGWLGDRLKVRVSAPPEQGKANQAVCHTLAKALGVSPRAVEIVAGHTSAEKTVEILGVTIDDAAARLPG